MRIGGVLVIAVSAWLTLFPARFVPFEGLVVAPSQKVQVNSTPPEGHPEENPPEEYQEVYMPPVDAEVVDFFRPPAHVGAPGNRGLEYDPKPGQPVRASAGGEVVFAGSVARNRFVTVLHRSGLRTSYGYLGWIAVAEGDWVVEGQLLGTTSERFFFSVRAGDEYLDPTQIMSVGRVRLVPIHPVPKPTDYPSRS